MGIFHFFLFCWRARLEHQSIQKLQANIQGARRPMGDTGGPVQLSQTGLEGIKDTPLDSGCSEVAATIRAVFPSVGWFLCLWSRIKKKWPDKVNGHLCEATLTWVRRQSQWRDKHFWSEKWNLSPWVFRDDLTMQWVISVWETSEALGNVRQMAAGVLSLWREMWRPAASGSRCPPQPRIQGDKKPALVTSDCGKHKNTARCSGFLLITTSVPRGKC